MYLTIDIGGTKTLIAIFNRNGRLIKRLKIVTNKNYQGFLKDLTKSIEHLKFYNFIAICIAMPGIIDKGSGRVIYGGGNIYWKDANLVTYLSNIYNCPVFIGNDADLAGLYESVYYKNSFSRVLYLTISTGIGGSYYVNQRANDQLTNFEPGKIVLEHNGQKLDWETFASGKSIVETYGKFARQIRDEKTWEEIAENISEGLFVIIPVLQPELIAFGGSIGVFFERYGKYLSKMIDDELNSAIPRPRLLQANKPDEAVIYGCYELIKLKSI